MSANYGDVIHRSIRREEAANVGSAGNLDTVRIVLRVVIGSLIAAVVVIALVPVFVLRNLSSGGTGWGLCESDVGGCSTSYFAGFELLAVLMVALLIVLALLRIATRLLRFTEHYYDRARAAQQAESLGAIDDVSGRAGGG
jgi:uncharacterized membrane protein